MRPFRMNLQPFRVRRLVRNQDIDPNTRQPTGDTVYAGKDGDPTTWEVFWAQIRPYKWEEKARRSLGGLPVTDGHLSYRSVLPGGSFVARLNDGDLIVQRKGRQGWEDVNWKVFGAAEPFAHTKGGENCFMSHFKHNDSMATDSMT